MPRQVDPLSKSIYKRNRVAFSGTRLRIYQMLDTKGPMTLFQIAAALKTDPHKISGRISELKSLGKIVSVGYQKPQPGQEACHIWDVKREQAAREL